MSKKEKELDENATKSKIGKSWSEAVSKYNDITKTNMALGATVFLLALKIFFQEPIVIIVPASIGEEITIQGDRVSPSYKKLFAHLIADTMGNVNPNNIDFKIDSVKKILSTRIRSLNIDSMKKHAQKMRLTKAEEIFSIDNVYYSESQDLVYVYGPKEIRQKGRKPIKTMWTYEMRIGARNGKPVISYIKQYPGSPKNAKSKTYSVKETIFDDMDDIIEMERPLGPQESVILKDGGVKTVGDDLTKEDGTKNETN